jgi:primosomal protein N' (replication factor Y)
VIEGLIDEGALETLVLPPEPVARTPDPDHMQPELAPAQQTAADSLRETVAEGGFGSTLIDGVTGSGKTQVYFEAIAEIVRRGRQALVLVPEIALDRAVSRSLCRALRCAPAEWHSQLSPRLRARTWAAVAGRSERDGRRALGAVPALHGARLIVVDEEHDPAYKQEDGVHYHARDMAVVRANVAKIPIVLASATPRSKPR